MQNLPWRKPNFSVLESKQMKCQNQGFWQKWFTKSTRSNVNTEVSISQMVVNKISNNHFKRVWSLTSVVSFPFQFCLPLTNLQHGGMSRNLVKIRTVSFSNVEHPGISLIRRNHPDCEYVTWGPLEIHYDKNS